MCSFKDLVEDGAPTGCCDPEYARGFRYGQEYGIEIGTEAGITAERERVIELLEPYAKSCENGDCDCLSAESTITLIKGEEE
jgi:hypothetical protein